MDKLNRYRSAVEQVITEYSHYRPEGEVEMQTVFDRERNHYELVNFGWQGQRRIRGCIMHLDIKGDKVWIQHDGTDVGIANDLLALGVPKEDIVLAFHPPDKRKYTGFAEN